MGGRLFSFYYILSIHFGLVDSKQMEEKKEDSRSAQCDTFTDPSSKLNYHLMVLVSHLTHPFLYVLAQITLFRSFCNYCLVVGFYALNGSIRSDRSRLYFLFLHLFKMARLWAIMIRYILRLPSLYNVAYCLHCWLDSRDVGVLCSIFATRLSGWFT